MAASPEEADEASAAAAEAERQAKKNAWPNTKVLEQWLMVSTKDADPGAKFLRRILASNPAYGAYLAADEELAELVQLFAKRFRAKILSSESPIMHATLYEPLCELVWRTVGHVLHNVVEMGENNSHLPISQLALGQIKMLIQTNEELSKQLKDSRRAYLKELVLLREKSRTISKTAQKALDSLQDEPVMFYEPLSYVLDQTTKDFVKEVVEERIKLEMKRGAHISEKHEETDHRLDELEQLLEQSQAECRKLQGQARAETDRARRMEEAETRVRKELENRTQELATKTKDMEEMTKACERMRAELKKSRGASSTATVTETVAVEDAEKIDELKRQMEEQLRNIAALEQRERELEIEKELQAHQLLEAKAEAECAAERTKTLQEQVRQVERGSTNTEVITDGAALRKQLEKHLQVEKELRSQIKDLEKALKEITKEQSDITKNMEKVEEDEAHTLKKKKSTVPDEGGSDAVRRATLAQAKSAEQLEELTRLKDELEKMQDKFNKQSVKLKALDGAEGGKGDADEARKWRLKYEELLEKFENLDAEHEALEHKVKILLEKLRKYGGDEAVRETLAEIKLDPPPARKKVKKKAWERLYEDAVRRVIILQKRREKTEEDKMQALVFKTKTATAATRRQVDALAKMQEANMETKTRFAEALTAFYEKNPGMVEADAEDGEDDFDASAGIHICETCGQPILGFIAPSLDRSKPSTPDVVNGTGRHVAARAMIRARTEQDLHPMDHWPVGRSRSLAHTAESDGELDGSSLSPSASLSPPPILRRSSPHHFGPRESFLLGGGASSSVRRNPSAEAHGSHHFPDAALLGSTGRSDARSPTPPALSRTSPFAGLAAGPLPSAELPRRTLITVAMSGAEVSSAGSTGMLLAQTNVQGPLSAIAGDGGLAGGGQFAQAPKPGSLARQLTQASVSGELASMAVPRSVTPSAPAGDSQGTRSSLFAASGQGLSGQRASSPSPSPSPSGGGCSAAGGNHNVAATAAEAQRRLTSGAAADEYSLKARGLIGRPTSRGVGAVRPGSSPLDSGSGPTSVGGAAFGVSALDVNATLLPGSAGEREGLQPQASPKQSEGRQSQASPKQVGFSSTPTASARHLDRSLAPRPTSGGRSEPKASSLATTAAAPPPFGGRASVLGGGFSAGGGGGFATSPPGIGASLPSPHSPQSPAMAVPRRCSVPSPDARGPQDGRAQQLRRNFAESNLGTGRPNLSRMGSPPRSPPRLDAGGLPWKKRATVAVPPPLGWTITPGDTGAIVPGRVPNAGALDPLLGLARHTVHHAQSFPVLERTLTSERALERGRARTPPMPPPEGWENIPANFSGGAGRPGLGVGQQRAVPVAVVAVGKERRRLLETEPLANGKGGPVTGSNSRFLVTPLVSQQSMAAGVTPPNFREDERRQ